MNEITYIGTEEQLIQHEFKKCDYSYTYMATTHYNVHIEITESTYEKVIKDNKTKTVSLGIVLSKDAYNINTSTQNRYRVNKFIIFSRNKRKNYGGYMSGISIVNEEITPYVKELIKKGIARVSEE